MTLTTLLTYIGIVAIALTLVNVFVAKNSKSWLMSLAQNFAGSLFVFSGWVKAVDPLGTAYKMEQYFDEFTYSFEPTWFGFITPLFEYFTSISIGFSVGMIIFEIVLGLMLLLGDRSKLTAWMFFGLVLFFTFLTGYTYLTGYVGEGGNIFNLDSWGVYKKSNMKVQDCGCFGDFIKLEPKTSFFKDVFLMIPAVFFVLFWSKEHQWFTGKIRNIILVLTTIGLVIYCLNNYVWNLPHADFRPFKIGANIAKIKEIEEEAAANVQITHWELKNNASGEIKTLPSDQYMSNLSTYNKTNGWAVVDQITTEPIIKPTKISAFEITDHDYNDVSYEYLEGENYNFMIVSHKMKYSSEKMTRTVQDSVFLIDTIITQLSDVPTIVKLFDKMVTREEEYYNIDWDENYIGDFVNIVKPLAEKAAKDGHKVSIVTGGADKEVVEDFAEKCGIKAFYYTADDILLKTIVRSNPGVVLWKDGSIVYKWHKEKLPDYETIKEEFIK